jgi:YD repeat-containing protein
MLYADGTRVTCQYDAVGRRTTMADSGGTATYAYSDRGELTRNSLPGGYVLTMTYDSVGNREVLINPDGGRCTYVYDSLNRISSVKDPDGNLSTFQYL